MRIGYDAKRLFNNFTGLGNYSRTLLHNLLAYEDELKANLYTPGIKYSTEIKEFLEHPSCNTFTPSSSKNPLWRSYFIKKQLEKDQIQLFHGLSNEIPFSLKKSSFPTVVTVHDLIFKAYPLTYPFLDRNIYDLKFSFSCRNASKVIAISESTRQDIIRYYKIHPQKVEVLYQACLPLFYKEPLQIAPGLLKQKYGIPGDYLLYVGSVIPRKNLKTIITAMDILPRELRIPLVIIGNGKKYKLEIQEQIARLGLEETVIWVGNMHDNLHLQHTYIGAKALIYPSVYEGFGLPVVEAMLSGTPVITSRVSSLPEAGGPAALYLENPLDATELAALISKILTDNSLVQKITKKGLTYARYTFDPQTLTRKLAGIYNQLI